MAVYIAVLTGITHAQLKPDALACVEDVPLAEMWSQGVFIDRRHGLAVVVLVF